VRGLVTVLREREREAVVLASMLLQVSVVLALTQLQMPTLVLLPPVLPMLLMWMMLVQRLPVKLLAEAQTAAATGPKSRAAH
jgi:flagellar biosynthesis protein FliQ